MLDRKLCFKALVGSHNYNLQTEESDKDYKIFFYPNFDDLYEGGKFTRALVSDDEDVEYHDIRKLPNLLFKSNVNFMEVLFSEEYEVYDEALFSKLFSLREEISKINLPYFYDACFGMFLRKMKEYHRDKEKDLAKKTYKHAMSAYRILDFLERFHNNSFSSFKQAIQYDLRDSARELLLNIRNGTYAYEQLEIMIEKKINQVKLLEYKYKSFEVNNDLKGKLDLIVKESVKRALGLK
ncbi:DNA polymerase beta superfamily protein [Calidifontibacillus erzurumensis]|uniref:DNA polymerase beta superfamily protein n=1 Tax=Calidifontibacillus erzurumensis TaxID=2741433 RepID=UPI0035B50E10